MSEQKGDVSQPGAANYKEALTYKTPGERLKEMGLHEYQRRCLEFSSRLVAGLLDGWKKRREYPGVNRDDDHVTLEQYYKNIISEGSKDPNLLMSLKEQINTYHALEEFKPLKKFPPSTEEIIGITGAYDRDGIYFPDSKCKIEFILGQDKDGSTISYQNFGPFFTSGSYSSFGGVLSKEDQDFLDLMYDKKKIERKLAELQRLNESESGENKETLLKIRRAKLQDLGVNPDRPGIF